MQAFKGDKYGRFYYVLLPFTLYTDIMDVGTFYSSVARYPRHGGSH